MPDPTPYSPWRSMFKDIPAKVDDPAKLEQSSAEDCSRLRRRYPELPQEYFEFLQEVGHGNLGNLVIYAQPMQPLVVYGPARSPMLSGIVLFGDDMQGFCYGFDLKDGHVVVIDPRGSPSGVDLDHCCHSPEIIVMKASIDQLIFDRLNDRFEFLREELQCVFNAHGGAIDQGTLRIGLNSKYGIGYSFCIIFQPILMEVFGPHVPAQYLSILRCFNGAKLYSIDLFGLPEEESNQRRCLSLVTANQFWINGFRGIPKNSFHIGGRAYSWDETIGYFHDANGTLFSARKSGEILMTWSTLEEMLRGELEIAKRIEIEMKDRLRKELEQSRYASS